VTGADVRSSDPIVSALLNCCVDIFSVRRRLDLEAGVRTLSIGTTRTLLALRATAVDPAAQVLGNGGDRRDAD
jgi:hypothetical protein